jgi:hypothetical protein
MVQGNLHFSIDDSSGMTSSHFDDFKKSFNMLRPNKDEIEDNPNLTSFSKIFLEPTWKKDADKLFSKINLNYSTLFPGISGIGGVTEDFINTKTYLKSNF